MWGDVQGGNSVVRQGQVTKIHTQTSPFCLICAFVLIPSLQYSSTILEPRFGPTHYRRELHFPMQEEDLSYWFKSLSSLPDPCISRLGTDSLPLPPPPQAERAGEPQREAAPQLPSARLRGPASLPSPTCRGSSAVASPQKTDVEQSASNLLALLPPKDSQQVSWILPGSKGGCG